ncbi:MAG: ABC transporter ATP-binding protein [Dermatophilus congolensis]|nr:ABC transporter ATP-binding protein [Dermatophilus congolensis]
MAAKHRSVKHKKDQLRAGALKRTLGLLKPHVKGSRLLMAGGVAAILLEVVARLLEPWPMSWVIDTIGARVLSGGTQAVDPAVADSAVGGIAGWLAGLDSPTLLILAGVSVVAVTALRAGAAYMSTVAFAFVGAQVSARLRAQVHSSLLAAPTAFHATARSGDLVTRVVSDVGRIQEAGVTAGLPLMANLITVVGMLIVVVVLDPVLGAVVVAVLPILALSGRRAGGNITAASRQQRRREGELAGDASEAFGAITTVQAYGLAEHLSSRFKAADSKGLGEGVKAKRLSAGLERRTDFIVGIATGVVLAVGGHRVLVGAISPGELVVFITYLKTTFKPLRDIAKHTGRIARASASGERIADTLRDAEPAPEPSWARPLPSHPGNGLALRASCGRVEVEGVTAGYRPDMPVLRDVDLVVNAGERIAIVGPSGAGKSTLLSLLMRFITPTAGSIRLDGHDLADVTTASVRDATAVVLQDSAVLSGTLADNVRLGRLDATDDDVIEALREAGLGEMIETHPEGIHRSVGERGVTLSGGQRQRLAVARAMVRRPRLVLLDEPSTGLDTPSVEALVDALQRLCVGRTTIVVTHDERLLRLVDRVVELRDGDLVEATPAAMGMGEGR